MPDAKPIIPVILSGGAGTRLWPLSRPEQPKQLLPLTAEQTMLQLTALRAAGERFAPPIVVANARHADQVEAQLATVATAAQALILEPAGRNTAPAIALAAIAAGGGADPVLVMPSDHVIADVEAFHAAIQAALPLVEQGWLVTFGIAPDAPETGYGWIKVGEPLAAGVHRVERFVEKPPRDRAEEMLAAGDHAWNGGIFLFRADMYLGALSVYAPAMLVATQRAMEKARREGIRVWPDAEEFAASPSDSIDYAVMEKAPRVAVVPVAMGWSDVGSWDALHAISECDAQGNVCRGDVIAIDAENCLIRSEAGKRVALVGVRDLIVVATGDDVLVLPRGRSQDVRKIIEAMQN
ncbi:mannose-1-phosphate guanylyltransferase/mannose-1-phosphate guanylyltransferase/mannose-6-phosphate isomerase [Sphingomonas naasensis]|uniref:mannose-1-phosphate guanylyltransferase n=1 Tax=Sphingomonas naasensis TaxID=1344951 RepID=A0A4S1W5M2_9SPHN|nr:mannose-1-phosphate guanylyltransferase/mannose-6-phosphate isomerase [Sphingomonas naasensis]NIJ19951.1 mannose-1-phosphate guanylyltransferase/mannose-1-phosphate guanylyltransferase/mannose-6-phosphate isomerase [Sphingomonas naasensis]TGX37908.1 mannose-1-phosphate guanylyltransferase/mannose-6-phosphate isomerase [Sphingomonas naasensis]